MLITRIRKKNPHNALRFHRAHDQPELKLAISKVIRQYGHTIKARVEIAKLRAQFKNPVQPRKGPRNSVISHQPRPHAPGTSSNAKFLKKPNLDMLRTNRDYKNIKTMLETIVTSEEATRWMSTSNSNLDGLSPQLAIRAGQSDRVMELIRRVQEGIYV